MTLRALLAAAALSPAVLAGVAGPASAQPAGERAQAASSAKAAAPARRAAAARRGGQRPKAKPKPGRRTRVQAAREGSRWRVTGFQPAAAAAPAAGPTPAAPSPSSPTGAPAPTPAPTPAPEPTGIVLPELPVADPRSVSVGATEFAFTLSQPSVAAGDVRVQFDNRRAEDPHDLLVLRNGAVVAHFGELAAGGLTFRSVSLRAGSYDLLCPLEGHVAAGMTATLTVRSGP